MKELIVLLIFFVFLIIGMFPIKLSDNDKARVFIAAVIFCSGYGLISAVWDVGSIVLSGVKNLIITT